MFSVGSSGGITNWHSNLNWSWIATTGTVFATLLGSVMFMKRRRRKSIFIPGDAQKSIEIGNGVYKSSLLKENDRDVVETMYPETTTLYECFQRGMKVSENGPCLGVRHGSEYVFTHYKEVFQLSHKLGSAFITKLGLKQGTSTHVGVYAKNCPEWFITMLACVRNSMVIVPLYDTLGAEAAVFIIEHTDAEVVVVDNEAKLNRLLGFGEKSPSLKHIVVIDEQFEFTAEQQERAMRSGIQLHKYKELIQVEPSELQDDLPPKPDDNYIICYTSGTTGTPKGVMLTHRNAVGNVSAFAFMLNRFLPEMTEPGQVILSYLPLSHMFEQCSSWLMIMLGGSIGYFSGDVNKLTEDMKALRPTLFPVVPRLLNRFYDHIMNQVNQSALSKLVFNIAYSRKLSKLRRGVVTNDSLWDKLVFKKAQQGMGGRVKLIVTGSAPVSPEVLDLCRVAFGAYILEGYGQTENTSMATVTWPGDCDNSCGGPAVCAIIRLMDVPDLGYFAKDGKGEILIKGPSVSLGYYKDPEKTAALFTEDRFMYTGDVGHLQPNGALRIIDRKKDIFKLAQGEYVAPEKIENVYCHSLLVQQVYVDGLSLERYLVGVVVPHADHLLRLYQDIHCNAAESLEQACNDKQTREGVLKNMQSVGKSSGLNSIEQVKAIKLEPEPWSVENGFLTPTLKAKRPQLRARYMESIQELYKNSAE